MAVESTNKHQTLSSIGPACTPERSAGGSKAATLFKHALDWAVKSTKRAKVGESRLA